MKIQQQQQLIVVPPEGIPLAAVLAALGLSFSQIVRLLGDELGAPRDYRMPPGSASLVFTAGGVRRLASLFGLVLEVIDVPVVVESSVEVPV